MVSVTSFKINDRAQLSFVFFVLLCLCNLPSVLRSEEVNIFFLLPQPLGSDNPAFGSHHVVGAMSHSLLVGLVPQTEVHVMFPLAG